MKHKGSNGTLTDRMTARAERYLKWRGEVEAAVKDGSDPPPFPEDARAFKAVPVGSVEALTKDEAEKLEIELVEDRPPLKFVVSDESVDRDYDVIKADGWDLGNYLKNPVVLWGHRYRDLPVARAVDVRVESSRLLAVDDFVPRDVYPFADTVYRMYRGGFLNAVSVGFDPLEWSWDDKRGGFNFIAQEMLEHSAVPVPANANALQLAKDAGVDVEPYVEWCERVLDEHFTAAGKTALLLPAEKDQLVAVWKAAGGGGIERVFGVLPAPVLEDAVERLIEVDPAGDSDETPAAEETEKHEDLSGISCEDDSSYGEPADDSPEETKEGADDAPDETIREEEAATRDDEPVVHLRFEDETRRLLSDVLAELRSARGEQEDADSPAGETAPAGDGGKEGGADENHTEEDEQGGEEYALELTDWNGQRSQPHENEEDDDAAVIELEGVDSGDQLRAMLTGEVRTAIQRRLMRETGKLPDTL